jgi:hypothetical protein
MERSSDSSEERGSDCSSPRSPSPLLGDINDYHDYQEYLLNREWTASPTPDAAEDTEETNMDQALSADQVSSRLLPKAQAFKVYLKPSNKLYRTSQ